MISIRQFRKIIFGYYRKHGREFPWRNTENQYHILVSEIMLQQTQTSRVVLKYEEFIRLFPDVFSLASASFASVLSAWHGLGYNRRARALKEIATLVVKRYAGELPKSVDLLILMPGIGHATASAICAFAFNQSTAFIETNIRSVFIHFFFKG